MNLFSSLKTCDYCGLQPKPKAGKKHLFNGFRDRLLNKLVCFNCKPKHDKLK